MPRLRQPMRSSSARDGVILLVVISLLVLFSLVGLAFVVYAEGQANTSRIWREGESFREIDMDPELLLAYFLGQLIYDTTDPTSALRGWGLATNMYGTPGSTIPFNGTGRLHTNAAPASDDYYNIDYTNYPGSGNRSPGQAGGSPNPSYTFPDFNHPYLAAIRPVDGTMLIPSYVRIRPDGTVVSLRPNTNYHTSFPKQASPSGDVKNRADGPGYNNGPNDSIWIDIGFPVMTAPDGRKFKPVFAPLIEDQDGKVSVNGAGNILGNINGNGYYPISHQGWNPGEINIARILNGPSFEVGNLFMGNPQAPMVSGRYDPTRWKSFWAGGGWGGRSNEELKNVYSPGGHFYLTTNLDCYPNGDSNSLILPGAGSGFGFPVQDSVYSHGWMQRNDDVFNSALWNYYDPRQNCYWIGSPPPEVANNRNFGAWNLETLVRYGDEGSPSMTSELFMLCPQSFASNPKANRAITTHSSDTVTAGLTPTWFNFPGSPSLYALGANNPYPTRPALNTPGPNPQPYNFPSPGGPPTVGGEFGPNWNGVSMSPTINTLLNRIDLNRGFNTYYPTVDPNQHTIPAAGWQPAQQERQQLAQDIFTIFRAVTGADNPATATPGTPSYDALRWLAQLSVNIVDFLNYPQPGQAGQGSATADDIMTCFNWNPAQTNSITNGWVFGTVLPRLVVNEAYIQISNTQSDQTNKPMTTTQYAVNAWVELHNPLSYDNGGAQGGSQVDGWQAIPLPDGGVARLYNTNGNFAAYRLILAQTTSDSAANAGNPAFDNTKQMTVPSNAQGIPVNIQTVVDQYTPDTSAQPTALNGDALNQVVPNYANGKMNPGSPGGNQGFYVLGPGSQGGHQKAGAPPPTPTPIAFPGTASNMQCFATLPVKQQASVTANDLASTPNALPASGKANSSMHYLYKPSNPQLNSFTQLNHTIVLQRLACPYMPYQPQPGQANFNPYVTVDYMAKVPISADSVTIDGVGQHMAAQNMTAPGSSVGRNQPYAADNTQQVTQTAAAPPPMGQPQHTFFNVNSQGSNAGGTPFQPFPYDWLVFANRPLISAIELLNVNGDHPHLLTQRFMTQGTDPNTGMPTPAGKFMHRAPWFQSGDGSTSGPMIHRALDFFEGGIRPQWTPPGGRTYGKININTIYDVDTFQCLCDQQPIHFFTAQAPANIYNNMISSRGMPGGGATRPFLGLAGPYVGPGGLQYPTGASIDDTILRSDPKVPPTNPMWPKRLLEPNPNPASGEIRAQANDQPYLHLELLNRIYNNTTTRSNVFAVWVTVGFFEVVGPGASGGPPQLGQEINFSTNRHIRHRMFAVVDRSNLTISLNTPGSPGRRPFFINSMTPVSQPGATTITLPTLSGAYENSTWSIQQGTQLVIDSGPNQEVVTVTGVNPVNLQFSATFTKTHPVGFAVSNALLGNPGPQPRFDMRRPAYSGVVPYFSILR